MYRLTKRFIYFCHVLHGFNPICFKKHDKRRVHNQLIHFVYHLPQCFKNNYSELEKTIPFKQIDFPFCCFRRQFRPRKELILDVKFDSLFLQIQLPHLTQLVTNDYLL